MFSVGCKRSEAPNPPLTVMGALIPLHQAEDLQCNLIKSQVPEEIAAKWEIEFKLEKVHCEAGGISGTLPDQPCT